MPENIPEKEIKIISERVEEKKAQMEKVGLPAQPEEALVKEVIEERIEESLKNLPPTTPTFSAQPSMPLAIKTEKDEDQQKLHELVNLALSDSIPKAVNLARKTGNFHLIDSLHDLLVWTFIKKTNKEKAI